MEPDKITLIDLLSRLPIGQLWSFLGVIAGLVAGAFGIGWKIRGTLGGAKVQSMDQLREKDRFLSLYLRYVMARDGIDTSLSISEARKALNEYVEGRVDRDKLIIHKGGGRLATIEFPDGTIWTLPKELHIVELSG